MKMPNRKAVRKSVWRGLWIAVAVSTVLAVILLPNFYCGRDAKMSMDRAVGFGEGVLYAKRAFEAELASNSPLAGLARVDQCDFQSLREEVKALSKRLEELTEELRKLKEKKQAEASE